MIEQAYRRFIIPGFESILKRRKTFRFWQELEDSQWWSLERLENLQLRRLRSVLEYCFEQSPYYGQWWSSRGLSLRELQSLSDIRKWPLTAREMMRDHGDRIRSTASGIQTVSKSTGGSSGAPLRFVIDHQANDRRTGAAYRGYSWAGAGPGTRQTHLWGVTLGNPSRLRRWKEYLYSRHLYRRDMLNSFELSDDSVPEFLARIHRFRPAVLVAYTNPIYQFARAIEQRGLRAYQPQAIVVGAEKLHDFQRQLLERVFAAPVSKPMARANSLSSAQECEQHRGLHLTMENLLVEVVDDDGQPTPAGQEGNVVVTDLFNIAMPFVRYVTGDRAISGLDTCSCGRGLPLLKQVVGRQLDTLVTADGRHLPGEFFPHLLKDHAAVRQFQVVQHQRDVVELKLVVDPRWDRAARESLRQEVQNSVGDATHLMINEVDTIPLTAMGKLRVVVGHPVPHAGSGECVLDNHTLDNHTLDNHVLDKEAS